MSADIITTCVIAVFLVILLSGFLFGLVRGFNKSLVRIIMVIATLVIAFFITPSITKALMQADISNMNITINGETATSVGDIIVTLLNEIPQISDISGTDAYANIINVVPQMILNVVLFLVVFLALRSFTMIIYWIIAGLCFSKKKTEGKNKHRLLGCLVGTVQNFIIFLAILVPVVGTINILGDIEKISVGYAQEQTSGGETTLASAEQPAEGESSSESGGTQSESQVSPYQTIQNVRVAYNNSWVAKFLHSVKLDNACMYVFNELSTIEVQNGDTKEEYNLRQEANSFSYIIIDFQTLTNLGELDLAKPECIEALNKLIDSCYKSKLTAQLVDEVIPIATSAWVNGETFCGFAMPVVSGYEDVIKDLLTQVGTSQDIQTALKNTTQLLGSIMGKAKDIIGETGDINIDKVGEMLTELGEDESTLEFAKSILTPENVGSIVDQVVPPSEGNTYNELIKETLNSVIGADYSEGTGNDFAKEVSVITETLKGAEKLADPETEFNQTDANGIVNSLSESTVIMDTITTEGSEIGAKLKGELDKAGNETAKQMVEDAVKNLDDNNANKQKLAEFLGIDLSKLPTEGE